ncbi:MAG: peptidoglycan editing factor PgeF [Candidatus Chromulinivorax sp.]
MDIYKTASFSIYFGNQEHAIKLEDIAAQTKTTAINFVQKQLECKQVIFLQQEHGIQGFFIQQEQDQDFLFNFAGDFIITQKKNCGIAVVTADCLPIIIFEPATKTIAIIHAGWKGLVAGIFFEVIKQLKEYFLMQNIIIPLKDLEIFVGPAARPCCYEVQKDFIDKFAQYQDNKDIFIEKNKKIYFDSTAFVKVIARNLGIQSQKIYTRYNVCTICNQNFCSYRKDKEQAFRQITMVCLH